MVNALVRTPSSDSHRYTVNLFIDGALTSSTEMLVEALSIQTSTLTIPSPKMGSAIRTHAEVLDEETEARYRESLLVPQSPPEAWISFAAFSSLTSILLSSSSSSSALSSSFTISYYKPAVGLEAQSSALTINVGLIMSVLLVLLLLFIELSDSVYGSIENRVPRLRGLYGLLTADLLLIFMGIVLTRTAMIIQG